VRVLLTGATGFLGANLARRLLARGDQVVCLVRKPNLCVEGLPVTLASAPMHDVDALTRVMDRCDGVYHVAGTFDTGPDGPTAMQALHVDATRTLLEACTRVGIRRFVFCSSSVTVGFGPLDRPGTEDTPFDPDPIYGRSGPLRAYYASKLEGERITAEWGGVIVNPDFVLGPWDVKPTSGQLLLSVARGWVPVHPRGGKCFVDVDDCAVGHIHALERGVPGRRYLLGNHNLSYRDFMRLCAEVAGRRGPVVPLPTTAVRLLGRASGVLQRVDPHRYAGLERHSLMAMQQERYRSGQRSWDELGVPRTDLRVTVESALRWFRDHGYCR
jgi:dihydroflavonol-4-reductase